jgi:hypothetical protein
MNVGRDWRLLKRAVSILSRTASDGTVMNWKGIDHGQIEIGSRHPSVLADTARLKVGQRAKCALKESGWRRELQQVFTGLPHYVSPESWCPLTGTDGITNIPRRENTTPQNLCVTPCTLVHGSPHDGSSVITYQTIRLHSPENCNLNLHHGENLICLHL